MPQVVESSTMDSSTEFINPHDNSIKYVLDLTKRLLKHVEFKGTFTEKRFVPLIEAYRDVISVDASERDFIKSLDYVKERLDRGILFKKWIGITTSASENSAGAPLRHNLWVRLPREIFGTYKFRVRTVEFVGAEIRLKLEILEQTSAGGAAVASSTTAPPGDEPSDDLSQSIRELAAHMRTSFFVNCRQFFDLLTVNNFAETVKFLAILLAAIFTFGVKSVHFFLEYLLKFMREFSNLIRVLTPIFTCAMNSVTHIVIGLFHYIYRLFRKEPDQVYVTNIPYGMAAVAQQGYQQRRLPISGSYQNYPRYITSAGVKITEIN